MIDIRLQVFPPLPVNFAAFHSTYEVDTPVCSAIELEAFFAEKDEEKKQLEKQKWGNV